ncbi:MAG: tRNA 2-thiocytidine(32) synthetase TtcA [Myxococcales bacterium]
MSTVSLQTLERRADARRPKGTSAARTIDALEHKIARCFAECCREWNLIEPGDRILVGVSGGKDSYALLHFLRRLQRVAPFEFSFFAFHLDQGHPGFPTEQLRSFLESEGYETVIHHRNTYDIVLDKIEPGATTCSLCSRLRRGILYDQAAERGCTKLALGHHRDDIIETFLLNLFFVGQNKGMPVRLRSDDGRNTVIRPLGYVPEEWIIEFAEAKGWPVIPCTLCSSQEGLKRERMKRLLSDLQREYPGVKNSLLAAMGSISPSTLLDKRLFDPELGSGPGAAPPAPASGDSAHEKTG